MGVNIQYFSIGFSFLFLIGILELIRKGKLLEQYSLLWILSATVMIIFSTWRGLLERVSRLMNVYYPPSLLFLMTLLFSLLLTLHFSVIVTKLSNQNIKLAQDLALLEDKLQKNEDVS